MERSNYLRRCSEGTRRRLECALARTVLVLVRWDGTTKGRALLRCSCGVEESRRVSDILYGQPYGCRSCTQKHTMKEVMERPEWHGHHTHMIARARLATAVPEEWTRLRRRCQVARDRCVNHKNASYANYGGRGITFEFTSATSMARWVMDNLGARPEGASIDRVNNNLGYAPGNLRWASRTEQANNKREYLGSVYGDRIRNLEMVRPDLCYETIRTWINKGLSDDEIKTRPKHPSGRPRIRHQGLRPA